MRGQQLGAWVVIIVLAIMVLIYIWMVPHSYRESELGIYERPPEENIPVESWIGEGGGEEVVELKVPLRLIYLIEEKTIDEGVIELSSNVFSIAEKEFSLDNGEYLYLEVLEKEGNLYIVEGGKKYEMPNKIEIRGPRIIKIRSEPEFLHFSSKAKINYRLFRREEKKIAVEKTKVLLSNVTGSGNLYISGEGSCNLKIFFNGKLLYDGEVDNEIFDVNVKTSNNLTFIANPGTDCLIKDVVLSVKGAVRKSFEFSARKRGKRLKIMLDITGREGKPVIKIVFIGRKIISTEGEELVVADPDIGEDNLIRIEVSNGKIYLKRVRLVWSS